MKDHNARKPYTVLKIIIAAAFILITGIIISLAVICTAHNNTLVASGECGENVSWELTENAYLLNATYTITISGNGDMTDYENTYYNIPGTDRRPWKAYIDSITNIVINEGVTSIGACAFTGLSELKSVSIADTVTCIGGYAFSSCETLTGIEISDHVVTIGDYAFSGCHSLAEISISGEMEYIGQGAFESCAITSFTLPDGIETIETCTFLGCTKLKNIYIPESVTAICNEAFGLCSALRNIYYAGPQDQWDEMDISTVHTGLYFNGCNIYFDSY